MVATTDVNTGALAAFTRGFADHDRPFASVASKDRARLRERLALAARTVTGK
jgi:hypothetical protein